MSQDFKIQFDENRESVSNNAAPESSDSYSQHGNVRNLAFQWPDGRRKFYNYSYLISCDYVPKDAKIVIEFSSEMVELTGSKLALLVEELQQQLPRIIRAENERYKVLEESDTWKVTGISIKAKQS